MYILTITSPKDTPAEVLRVSIPDCAPMEFMVALKNALDALPKPRKTRIDRGVKRTEAKP